MEVIEHQGQRRGTGARGWFGAARRHIKVPLVPWEGCHRRANLCIDVRAELDYHLIHDKIVSNKCYYILAKYQVIPSQHGIKFSNSGNVLQSVKGILWGSLLIWRPVKVIQTNNLNAKVNLSVYYIFTLKLLNQWMMNFGIDIDVT